MRLCHLELHPLPLHLGGDRTGQRLKREGRPCYPFQMSKTGNTPTSVAAHLCFASIRIIKAPFEIGLLRPLDQDETVRSHGNSSLTDFSNEILQTIFFQEGVPMIDEDEIVSAPAHFRKRNFHYASGLKQVKMPDVKLLKIQKGYSRSNERHSKYGVNSSGNPEKHWIPGQARNDKVHKTCFVMYNFFPFETWILFEI
jgi:hypothetical protein